MDDSGLGDEASSHLLSSNSDSHSLTAMASSPPFIPHSLPTSSLSSINYGDGDVEGGEQGQPSRQRSSPLVIVTSEQGARLVRMPASAQTWRNWSPARSPAGLGKKREVSGELEEDLKVRRSLDWSVVRGEQPKLPKVGSSKKEKEEKGELQATGKKSGEARREKGKNGDAPDAGKGESESESESDIEAKPLLKEKKRGKKAKKKGNKALENEHVHGKLHEEKDREDIENQLKREKKRKKKRKKGKHPEDFLPIYLERERRVLPLMEPLPQVLGFVGWQIATFVLGLSLGIFLSGITPGYDVSDVGINSHWWQVEIHKPAFQPPDEMLAPMWISSFCLAAVGMWVVWRRGGWKWNKLATSFYLIHLFIFQIWLCLFFFLHELFLAVVTALIGWVIMLLCLIAFAKRSWIAVGLLSFAFAWKTFVVLDVLIIWWLNSNELAKQT